MKPGAEPGTLAGASRLADIAPGGYGSAPAGFVTTDDGSLYFSAETPSLGRELYRLAAGGLPQLVADIAPGTAASAPYNLSAAGNAVYFAGYDSANSSTFFWRYDPATGAPQKVTNPSGTVLTRGSKLVKFGDRWYFGATGPNGAELYRTDGTSKVAEQVKDIYSGFSDASPAHLTVAGDWLYFAARDSGGGLELWKSDGTANATQRVADMTPGSTGSEIAEMFAFGGVVYFNLRQGTTDARQRLWRSDGTPAGTYPLFENDIEAPRSFSGVGGKLFFTANDAQGRALFAYDPSGGSTPVLLTPAATPDGLPLSANYTHAAGERVYTAVLAGATRNGQMQLWQSDGTSDGTGKVADVQPMVPVTQTVGLGAYWVLGMFAFGSNSTHLFFPAWSAPHGLEPHALRLGEALPDTTAPAVSSAGPDPDAPSARLRVTFSEDVFASLAASDLRLQNLTAGQPVDPQNVHVTFDAGTLTATFSFSALLDD